MDLILIGNIIGVVAVIENIFIFATLKRKNILKFKFLSDALWFLNYLFLGALTGAVLNIIAMFRETVFSLRGKKKFASHFFWLPVFLLLTLISPTLDCIKAGACTYDASPRCRQYADRLQLLSEQSKGNEIYRFSCTDALADIHGNASEHTCRLLKRFTVSIRFNRHHACISFS